MSKLSTYLMIYETLKSKSYLILIKCVPNFHIKGDFFANAIKTIVQLGIHSP